MAYITTVGVSCTRSFTQFCFEDSIAAVLMNKGVEQVRMCEHPSIISTLPNVWWCRRCGEMVEEKQTLAWQSQQKQNAG